MNTHLQLELVPAGNAPGHGGGSEGRLGQVLTDVFPRLGRREGGREGRKMVSGGESQIGREGGIGRKRTL